MRVLVDATMVPADRKGVGRYLDNVVRELDRLGTDLVIACQPGDRQVWAGLAPGARLSVVPQALRRRPVRLAWEQTGLAALATTLRADVLFSPHYTTSYAAPLPKVVCLHDATFFSDPQVHEPVKARFFRSATRASLRAARACIVPSAATRDELVRWAGARPQRIEVVHHGVDAEVFHPVDADTAARFAAGHGLSVGGYIAFLGTLEPRKNLVGLVRGYVQAFETRPDPPALVIAGATGWDRELDAVLATVPDRLLVVRPGYLPVTDLAAFFSAAGVVAYPSLGEGFGLPVLEAMACGACVLTTRRLALPEVGGTAVAYTEPEPDAIAQALRSLHDAPERRAELAAAGLTRARLFSWQRAGRAHLAVLERAAHGRTSGGDRGATTPSSARPVGSTVVGRSSGPDHLPRVVVLLATYNGVRYLDEQLRSILDQRGVRVRVVACDDGSTDGTAELLAGWCAADPRVTTIEADAPAGGAAANFYRLLCRAEVADGELVALSDQDDRWVPDKLARQAELIAAGVAGVSSDVVAFNARGDRTLIRKAFPQRRFDFLFESPGPGSSFLLDPGLVAWCRRVLTDPALPAAAVDYHDWMIYGLCRALGRRWQIMAEPTVEYRQHADNVIGAHLSWRARLHRVRLIASSWHREEARKMCALAVAVAPESSRRELRLIADLLADTSVRSRIALARRAGQFRRRRRDRLILAALILAGVW